MCGVGSAGWIKLGGLRVLWMPPLACQSQEASLNAKLGQTVSMKVDSMQPEEQSERMWKSRALGCGVGQSAP